LDHQASPLRFSLRPKLLDHNLGLVTNLGTHCSKLEHVFDKFNVGKMLRVPVLAVWYYDNAAVLDNDHGHIDLFKPAS
jgi:hypothetical protein